MAVHDFRSQRLFVDTELVAGARHVCSKEQANYLRNVLRLQNGATILIFNGVDGEWRVTIEATGRRDCALRVDEQVRPQSGGPDVHYLFAPLKRGRLDYMVQKATELGVSHLQPVMTQHTVADRVNVERLRANVIEAAEQCGVLRVPTIAEPCRLTRLLDDWPAGRTIVFADEAADIASPIETLRQIEPGMPCAVLVGPEGGFADNERQALLARDDTLAVSLGPRIMRADTAAVSVLALVNAVIGDWC